MPKKSEHAGNSSLKECARRRVAESSIAAVDECDCGMFQLHLGALTLRLTPPALAELRATLGRALATVEAVEAEPATEATEVTEPIAPFLGARRGEA